MKQYFYNLPIAFESMLQNKVRAFLTSFGIICGVASVIAMLAIGKGAEQEILDKMKLLGTNNIIIKKISKEQQDKNAEEEENSENSNDKSVSKRFSPGLTLDDADALSKIPNVKFVSSEIEMEAEAIRAMYKVNARLIGVGQNYFELNSLNLESGSDFTLEHHEMSMPVCVIGFRVKTKLFPKENPIGKRIKVGNNWLTVVGVVNEKQISDQVKVNLGIRDFNFDIYTPINSYLLRYENRALITREKLVRENRQRRRSRTEIYIDRNQIDKIIVQIANTNNINEITDVINRKLIRRHNQVLDYEIIVPELLLQQEQSTKRIFNIVLGIIASISLIVGGIGIMNIMLATVLERTKEIGIRMAVGAKQMDILLQFLIESVIISLSGGIVGIILGVVASYLIENLTDITTIISPIGIFISFGVSISVGLIFGIAPARKASKQNAIELLRYQ